VTVTLAYVTLTGTFEDGKGNPLNGTATFTPNTTVYASGGPVLQPDVPVEAVVTGGELQDSAGQPLKLLATDNAGLSYVGQTGFVFWKVQLTIGGVEQDPWSFFLPSSPSTRDLYSLAGTGVAVAPLPTTAGGTGLDEASLGALLTALLAAGGGTMGAELSPKVVALTDAATIKVDASQGNDFRVTLGGARTMGEPSNPVDGQSITFELVQDGTGSRTVTWTSGAGGYSFGSGSAPTLSTAAGTRDLVAFRYSASKGEWLALGSALGF
jgi:hypothetical protein